jgi:hypothetical protein
VTGETDVEVLGTRVVGAVDHGSDGEGEGHSELGASLGYGSCVVGGQPAVLALQNGHALVLSGSRLTLVRHLGLSDGTSSLLEEYAGLGLGQTAGTPTPGWLCV